MGHVGVSPLSIYLHDRTKREKWLYADVFIHGRGREEESKYLQKPAIEFYFLEYFLVRRCRWRRRREKLVTGF